MSKRNLLMMGCLVLFSVFVGCKKDNDKFTESDLYGTWGGTAQGVNVTVVITSSGWTLSAANGYSDYGSHTYNGGSGGLYSTKYYETVGSWNAVNKNTITVSLNSNSIMPGTYTLMRR